MYFHVLLLLAVIRWAWLCLQTFHSYLSRDQVKSLTENISESVEALKKRPAVPADTPEDEIVSSSFPVLSVPQISVMRPQPLDPQLSVKQSKTLFSSLLVSNQEEVSGNAYMYMYVYTYFTYACTCTFIIICIYMYIVHLDYYSQLFFCS